MSTMGLCKGGMKSDLVCLAVKLTLGIFCGTGTYYVLDIV